MKISISTALIAIVVALVVTSLSLFTVDQRQNAIVFRLGEIVSVKTAPGLFFKVPLVDNVRYFDARILTLDAEEAQRFVTSENKPVLVDSFVKWRIVDVRQYYVSVQRRRRAGARAADRRPSMAACARNSASARCMKSFGRARQDHGPDAREGGRDRARDRRAGARRALEAGRSSRRKSANPFTAGCRPSASAWPTNCVRPASREAEKIRADADKQRQVIIAQAYRDAQRLKGDGDAKASAIYARAFERNPEFYAFYRSLEAYKQSFKNKGDVLVLEPNSEFFKYLKNPAGRAK